MFQISPCVKYVKYETEIYNLRAEVQDPVFWGEMRFNGLQIPGKITEGKLSLEQNIKN